MKRILIITQTEEKYETHQASFSETASGVRFVGKPPLTPYTEKEYFIPWTNIKKIEFTNS